MAKNGQFWRVFENLKLVGKQFYQTGQFKKGKNLWKMTKLKNQNAPFSIISTEKIPMFFENDCDLVEREIRQVTKVTFFDDFEGFRIWCKTLESETAEDHLLELTCVSDALMIDEGVRRISILG